MLLVTSVILLAFPAVLFTLLKLVSPTDKLRTRVLQWLNEAALCWVGFNLWWMRRWIGPPARVEMPDQLSPDCWWMVISNHRSWTDVFLILQVLHRRISMPRFFAKRSLLWFPVVGMTIWALEFPIMRRYSRQQIDANPTLADIDRKSTQHMCQRARKLPMTLINFAEGTRFSEAKRQHRQSHYRHLLMAKAGGTAKVLNLVGDRLSGIVDITLYYPNPTPTFWRYLCGRETGIHVIGRRLEVPAWMQDTEYDTRAEDKERFHAWINMVWQEKDALLDRLDHDHGADRHAEHD